MSQPEIQTGYRSLSCFFTEIVFSIFAAFSVSDSLVHIRSNPCTTVFGKHCECIAQKCTHLERLPPCSTTLHLHCQHFTRVCSLCHSSLSNSGNVSGHHLAGGNQTSYWSSFVSFVASFSLVQFCHPYHLSSYSRWLCPLIST